MAEESYTFKVCMVVESGVGKTSIRRSFMGMSFKKDHKSTIGGDFSVKKLDLPDGHFMFSIWEVDPNNNFKKFRRQYLRNSYAAIIVFDVMRYGKNLESMIEMIHEIDLHTTNAYGKIPLFIIGNKIDLIEDTRPIHTYLQKEILPLEEFQDRRVNIIYTSCKTGENINEMFYLMKVSIMDFVGEVQVTVDELITKNKLDILETERELENIHEISEYFSVEKFNIVKVMILRNKYSEKLVACAFTGGSRVDRRTLVDLDEGGTKAWVYVPNDDLERVCGYPAGGLSPVGLGENIKHIFVDPRVLKKDFVIFPLGTNRKFGQSKPELLLSDVRAEERVISMG